MIRLFFLIFFFVQIVQSQNSSYKVIYRHCVELSSKRKLANGSEGAEAVLAGDNNSSNYMFYKLMSNVRRNDSLNKSITLDKVLDIKQSGQIAIAGGSKSDTIGNMMFYDKKKDSFYVREKMSSGYILMYEKAPLIEWQLGSEKKQIAGHICTKATASFRGRNYTAWFAEDIQIADGPWKFKGLPGLLLEISDDLGQVKIYAVNVEVPLKEEIPAFVPLGKKITLQQYVEYRNNEAKEFNAKMLALLNAQQNLAVDVHPTVSIDVKVYGIEKTEE